MILNRYQHQPLRRAAAAGVSGPRGVRSGGRVPARRRALRRGRPRWGTHLQALHPRDAQGQGGSHGDASGMITD